MQARWILVPALFAAACATQFGAPVPAPSTPDVFDRAIESLNGHAVDPLRFAKTLTGFQEYLSAVGVHGITADELTRPNHPDVAARLGFSNFLPPQQWWPRGAALALLTEKLQSVAGDAVHIRNWWRPAAYNADPKVAGAKNGDHPTANAFDLDYATVAARRKAEAFLRTLEREKAWLQLSLGLGAQTTHIGIGSARGHREWHYAGWSPVQ